LETAALLDLGGGKTAAIHVQTSHGGTGQNAHEEHQQTEGEPVAERHVKEQGQPGEDFERRDSEGRRHDQKIGQDFIIGNGGGEGLRIKKFDSARPQEERADGDPQQPVGPGRSDKNFFDQSHNFHLPYSD